MKTLLTTWLLLFGWASAAQADVLALIPPWHQGTDGAAVAQQIVQTIARDLAGQSLQALNPEQTASAVSPAERVACSGGACAERYRAASGATAAVIVRVYRAGADQGPATSFQVSIQPEPGLEYTAGAVFKADAQRAEQVTTAFREALRAYRRGPGPWIIVRGDPSGAEVLLDDKFVGTLPLTLPASVGLHQLRVQASGFEARTRLVTLPAPGSSVDEAFTLEPARVGTTSAEAPGAGQRAGQKRAWNTQQRWGAGLLAAGVPTFIVGAVWTGVAAARGERERCIEVDATSVAPCATRERQPSHVGAAVSVAAVGAIVGLTGGILFARGKRASRLSVEASASHALITLRGEL